MNKSYLTNPRVQQSIMKASRFGPVRRNIMNQIIAQEADKDQQKKLWSMHQTAQTYARNKALSEQARRFNMDFEAGKDWDDYTSGRDDIATGVSAGNAVMSGAFGYNNMRKKQEQAKQHELLGQKLLAALGEI